MTMMMPTEQYLLQVAHLAQSAAIKSRDDIKTSAIFQALAASFALKAVIAAYLTGRGAPFPHLGCSRDITDMPLMALATTGDAVFHHAMDTVRAAAGPVHLTMAPLADLYGSAHSEGLMGHRRPEIEAALVTIEALRQDMLWGIGLTSISVSGTDATTRQIQANNASLQALDRVMSFARLKLDAQDRSHRRAA